MDQFSALVELMKTCIDKHGLWPTVVAFCTCSLFLTLLALVWRLPNIIAALPSGTP